VVDDLGALTHYIGIQNDITKRLELAAEADSLLRTALEDRSRALEAARARDVLLAVVSHELRSPLNSIRLWASLLQADVSPDPATFQKALRQIDASVDAQSRLINDLLDVSRFVSGKLELEREPVDACALAKEVGAGFQPAAEAKGLRLEIRCPDGPALLDADRTRIVQIARNLIENAIKFTPRGGHVEVVVEVSDEEIELRVRDDGAGIIPEHLPRIFDQFWQGDLQSSRRQGGLGLGLSIVKFVVERHGGQVSAESGGPGRGSTFTVRLPRVQTEPHVAPPAELPEPAAPAAEGDVLVVDDERDTAEALALSLRARGLRVRVAFDVPSALAAVASQRPRIVVSDLVMPDLSGFDLLKTIREEERERGLPRIHAVAISGRGDPSDRWRVRRSGFDAFIAKPVNAQAVFQWIDGRKAKPRTLRPASLSVMVLGGEDDLLHHLRGDGHQVWQVRDLLEASRAGAQIRPDVLLVDLDAVRGNVEDLVGRLREDRLSLFVVGLSADPLKPRDGETYDSLLEKPFRAEILKRTLEQARPS
jgi:signal transduction histidine kinase/CheY-like chemotaxis protein